MTAIQLRYWRTSKQWNQTQAARYLGTTQVNVSRWEAGTHGIPGCIDLLIHLYGQERNLRSIETFLYANRIDK